MLRAFADLAWSRLRHRWRPAAARWLGLSPAVALALTIALTQALAGAAGFAGPLRGVGPRGVVTVERPQTRDAGGDAAFQGEVRTRVGRELGAELRPEAGYLASAGMRPVTLTAPSCRPT